MNEAPKIHSKQSFKKEVMPNLTFLKYDIK